MAEEEYPKTRNCSVPTPEEVVELIERLRSLENDLREKMETRSQNVRRVVSVAFRLIKSFGVDAEDGCRIARGVATAGDW